MPERPPISAVVAMIHVADVETSAAFYRLLGFEIGNRVPKVGPPHWAWLYSPAAPDWKRGANLMLARTERPLNPDVQDVLFYLYASDLVALREKLLGALNSLQKLDIGGMEINFSPTDHTGLIFADLSIIGPDGKFRR